MVWAISYHSEIDQRDQRHFGDDVAKECVVCEDQAQQGCGEIQGLMIHQLPLSATCGGQEEEKEEEKKKRKRGVTWR
jgi:hypothetical protein